MVFSSVDATVVAKGGEANLVGLELRSGGHGAQSGEDDGEDRDLHFGRFG